MDEPPVNQAHDQGQRLVGKTGVSVAAALSAYAVARLAPPLAGLTDAGQAVLGTVLAGTILWIAEALPLGVTALIVLVLLAIAPAAAPDALARLHLGRDVLPRRRRGDRRRRRGERACRARGALPRHAAPAAARRVSIGR